MYIKITNQDLTSVLDTKRFLPCQDYTKFTGLEPLLNSSLVGLVVSKEATLRADVPKESWPTNRIEVAEIVLAKGIIERTLCYLQEYFDNTYISEVGTMPNYIIIKASSLQQTG